MVQKCSAYARLVVYPNVDWIFSKHPFGGRISEPSRTCYAKILCVLFVLGGFILINRDSVLHKGSNNCVNAC